MLDLETKLLVREICGEVIQKWTIWKYCQSEVCFTNSRLACSRELEKSVLPTQMRLFERWRHFTTTTRIIQGFAFLCKLGLLLFKPQWDYQI